MSRRNSLKTRHGKRAVSDMPSFCAALADCRVVHAWKYKLAECLSLVHIQAYSAVPPSYTTVMDLNRKLEAFPVYDFPAYGASGQATADMIMQRHMSKSVKQEGAASAVTIYWQGAYRLHRIAVLLYLHRG